MDRVGIEQVVLAVARHWYWPPESRIVPVDLTVGKARRGARQLPGRFLEADAVMREGVQVKYLSMTSLVEPMASKIWAPR